MHHIIIFLRPLRYLNPGTGSVLVQLIIAALGGGLFFFIKSKWNSWFGKGRKKAKAADDIEENAEEGDAPVVKTARKTKSVTKTAPKAKSSRPAPVSKKTSTKDSKKRG